jgi:hypothetical protein
MPFAQPIPKQWPDGQPGFDFMLDTDALGNTFYAKLYDADNADYADLNVVAWKANDFGYQWRVWLDGESGSGVEDGYYTIKIFDTSDDSLLLESEPLIVGDWFEDYVPFEYSNFENDFGIVFDNGSTLWTGRMLLPVRIYDPGPQFEKTTYKNDPGQLVTLRTIPQRIFNFDSLPIPAWLAEKIILAFSCSILYLDRIKINSEENPEADLIDGSNLKTLTGQAAFVGFNDNYYAEVVETEHSDQSKIWSSYADYTGTITLSQLDLNDATLSPGGVYEAVTQSMSYTAGDKILVKLVLTDNASSDLPEVSFVGSAVEAQWGTNWFFYCPATSGTGQFKIEHTAGESAQLTAVVNIYKVE